jgi:hypothetical protein
MKLRSGFLQMLSLAHAAGRLKFHGDRAGLANDAAFAAFLAPLRKTEWIVYAREPFGGPKAALAYLSRYTAALAARDMAAERDCAAALDCIKPAAAPCLSS